MSYVGADFGRFLRVATPTGSPRFVCGTRHRPGNRLLLRRPPSLGGAGKPVGPSVVRSRHDSPMLLDARGLSQAGPGEDPPQPPDRFRPAVRTGCKLLA